ncbi:MAG: cryptochrome/photolyase family protein [Prochlorococcaceae cyanobacterium]
MKGIWALPDQLSLTQSALAALETGSAPVLLLESTTEARERRSHCQKLVLVWSAMRHFATELEDAGWMVDHREVDSFRAGLAAWISERGITELHLMEPAERPFRALILGAVAGLGTEAPKLVWHPSNAFLWSREEFAAWAGRYKQLRMELFYREGRRRFGVLMDAEGQPLGGQWNYDQANRKPPPKALKGPEPIWFEPDGVTRAVIEKVERLSAELESAGEQLLPGDAGGFRWGVTRQQALAVLEHFITTRLDGFGPYQDAMVNGEPTLWHSLLSPYLNLGLLHPLEVIRRLEAAGRARGSPLAGLEGVIRQILGWREYTHGLYWWFGADYTASNHFGADRPLPEWLERLAGSGMACMDTVLGELESNGYAHHIQRLMVLANYGLIAGLDPQAFTAWFSRMFIDGYDWVMQTNVIGMGLFADGGRLASKPYAASGSYINRMSSYCTGCRYNPKQRSGANACPFNALYWDFLARHAKELRHNPRMGLVLKQLRKQAPEDLAAIRSTAAAHQHD